jgi:hypothetical protein
MVAIKYEEAASASFFDPRHLVRLLKERHSLEELVAMEFKILSTLDFKITVATANSFLGAVFGGS